jgi:hypothetical protein
MRKSYIALFSLSLVLQGCALAGYLIQGSAMKSVVTVALPSVAPTSFPVPAPSTTPAPTPSATPIFRSIVSNVDSTVIEKTTFNGKIFEDSQSPLDGVTIKTKSLNSSVPYEAETFSVGGSYAFNNAPSGVQVEIIASKPGFTTRKRVEVFKSNKQGDPNANRYDFGTDGGEPTFSGAYNALSDKPEVVAVTPGRNASGVSPATTNFTLKFSEPMDVSTVTENFAVRISQGSQDDFSGQLLFSSAQKNFKSVSINSDIEFIFSIGENSLSGNSDYQISFTAQGGLGGLKDKSGITRSEKHFKLTDGNFENSYKFSTN